VWDGWLGLPRLRGEWEASVRSGLLLGERFGPLSNGVDLAHAGWFSTRRALSAVRKARSTPLFFGNAAGVCDGRSRLRALQLHARLTVRLGDSAALVVTTGDRTLYGNKVSHCASELLKEIDNLGLVEGQDDSSHLRRPILRATGRCRRGRALSHHPWRHRQLVPPLRVSTSRKTALGRGSLYDFAEGFGVSHREIREDLAVETHFRLLQRVHQARIGCAVLAGARIDPGNP
jgi:hypothetical protein